MSNPIAAPDRVFGATGQTFASPVTETLKWVGAANPDLPLLNVAQAAPVAPPPKALRDHMARLIVEDTFVHLYGAVLGQDDLRAALAARTGAIYQGQVSADQVAITSGCNQAFATAVSTLAQKGDEVILPTPWYFNHKMWLDMCGVTSIALPTGPGLIPDPDHAARLITPRTKAVSLVSPNNPSGAEYPAEVLTRFMDLCAQRGIALILDETYRDFHAAPGAPHRLFSSPGWDQTLIHLYSFSKAYRLTGHRVGAMITSPARLQAAEKFLDTVTICPTPLGQAAALWGLENLQGWLAAERDEILARRAAVTDVMPRLSQTGWQLSGVGAYFAYLRHPFAEGSGGVARKLVQDQSILCLPASMFAPEKDARAAAHLRIAFANCDVATLQILADRLARFTL